MTWTHLQSLQVLLLHASVDHKEVAKRGGCSTVHCVLYSAEVGDQFRWLMLLANPLVMCWECITLEAKVTHPKLCSEVNLAENNKC